MWTAVYRAVYRPYYGSARDYYQSFYHYSSPTPLFVITLIWTVVLVIGIVRFKRRGLWLLLGAPFGVLFPLLSALPAFGPSY